MILFIGQRNPNCHDYLANSFFLKLYKYVSEIREIILTLETSPVGGDS